MFRYVLVICGTDLLVCPGPNDLLVRQNGEGCCTFDTARREPLNKWIIRIHVKKNVSHETLVETMLHLSLIVEEKIAKEMKDQKGCILHDGWSKYGRHYVALMASYLVERSEGDFENVVRLLSCSTLPHDKDENCTYYSFTVSVVAIVLF